VSAVDPRNQPKGVCVSALKGARLPDAMPGGRNGQ